MQTQVMPVMRAALLSALAMAASAQTQDTSGNGMLKGAFHFRHIAVQIVDAGGDPTDITAVHGTITFDGAGNYTMNATSVDNGVANGAPQPLTVSGTYAIASNGLGYLTSELYPTDPNLNIYGSVAQGVFTGSSTESQQSDNTLNDIFIAIPASASAPTNASFTSAYQTGVLDFPGADSSATKNALFELIPDGKGNVGAFTITGQAANVETRNEQALTQSVSGATYSFNSDGSATLTVPLPSGTTSTTAMFTGTKTMFQSADGNFILGWTSTGFDIFFGVKALAVTGTNNLIQGLYFTAGLQDEPPPLAIGTASYYGGTYNTGDSGGDGLFHQRLNVPTQLSEDFGSDNQILVNADGSSNGTDFNFYQYNFGVDGQAFVAIGTAGEYALVVGMHAPSFTGTGVYLNPIGIVNAASYQPVTASLAPGELISLFGTGLASTTTNVQGGLAFPTTLGGVQVMIDNYACPLYYVSPTELSVIVPYEVATNQTGLANIQVINNIVQSNTVQMYLTDAAPGSFSQTENGIGSAAALHASTNELITISNPAKAGEYISLYLTGLGTVTPTIHNGAVGPSSPLSYSDLFNAGSLTVYFNDYTNGTAGNLGNVQYAGLAPALAGLYQINVQVPTSGLVSGDDVYIEFVTDAADVNQIQIPFGFGAPTPQSRIKRVEAIRAHAKRTSQRLPRPAARAAVPQP
jgi:uncharacterized protein (TIGR03437 family)